MTLPRSTTPTRSTPPTVCVAGAFPPPFTGQALATQRLADLLPPLFSVERVDLTATSDDRVDVRAAHRFADKLRRYTHSGRALRRALRAHPQATVLWTTISPQVLGHVRDLLTVYPALGGRRTFGVVHWGNFDRIFRAPATALTARRLARRLRGFVFLDATLSERCAPWLPPDRRFVIPNTIDEALLCTPDELARKRAGWGKGGKDRPIRALFLSNMIREKGYLDVLEAVRRLHEQGRAPITTFAGRWLSEDDRGRFEGLVARYGLQDHVRHLGPITDRARIKALYLDADLFLLPTYYPTEAQPLTIIEALNAGTPVVATRHAGIPEMVRDEHEGRLVPPRNPAALADAVAHLTARDVWPACSDAARRRFETHFSSDSVRHQWAALITDA